MSPMFRPIEGGARSSGQAGFTLTETLIAVAIIGVVIVSLVAMMRSAEMNRNAHSARIAVELEFKEFFRFIETDIKRRVYQTPPTPQVPPTLIDHTGAACAGRCPGALIPIADANGAFLYQARYLTICMPSPPPLDAIDFDDLLSAGCRTGAAACGPGRRPMISILGIPTQANRPGRLIPHYQDANNRAGSQSTTPVAGMACFRNLADEQFEIDQYTVILRQERRPLVQRKQIVLPLLNQAGVAIIR